VPLTNDFEYLSAGEPPLAVATTTNTDLDYFSAAAEAWPGLMSSGAHVITANTAIEHDTPGLVNPRGYVFPARESETAEAIGQVGHGARPGEFVPLYLTGIDQEVYALSAGNNLGEFDYTRVGETTPVLYFVPGLIAAATERDQVIKPLSVRLGVLPAHESETAGTTTFTTVTITGLLMQPGLKMQPGLLMRGAGMNSRVITVIELDAAHDVLATGQANLVFVSHEVERAGNIQAVLLETFGGGGLAITNSRATTSRQALTSGGRWRR
jgi:hypothetical protein